MSEQKQEFVDLFIEMAEHLDYCGYGDSWERECAGDLPERVEAMKDKLTALTKDTSKRGEE